MREAERRLPRPSIADVAAYAGVSKATVSRVVTGRGFVADDPRERVQAAIAELGYLPDPSPRPLLTPRANAVALLVAERVASVLTDPYFSAILGGISQETDRAGLQLVLLMAQGHEDHERVTRYLKAAPVDGVLLISGHAGDQLTAELDALSIPYVIGGRPAQPDVPAPFVDIDNTAGSRLAARHLLSTGRRRIGTVTGPLDMSAGVDRLAGFRAAMGERFASNLVEPGDFTKLGGEAATTRILQRDPRLDGLFAASDLMALGALNALHRAGKRVPQDVAVVGYDDARFARTTQPPLTTIRQDIALQGRVMVRLYLEINRPDIDVPTEPGVPDLTGVHHVSLPVSLVVRDSA